MTTSWATSPGRGAGDREVAAIILLCGLLYHSTELIRLLIAVAGAAQDTLDGILNAGSSTDIDKAQYQATMLTAAAWTPNDYTGPLNPADLITYAIETDKKLLETHQDAVAAIEKALTDKTELTGVEVHRIFDSLSTPHLKPAYAAAG